MGSTARRWAYGAALLVMATATAMAVSSASADPTPPIRFLGNGMGPVSFLRFSPDGKELIRVCQFGGVEMYATDGYDRLRTFEVAMRMPDPASRKTLRAIERSPIRMREGNPRPSSAPRFEAGGNSSVWRSGRLPQRWVDMDPRSARSFPNRIACDR